MELHDAVKNNQVYGKYSQGSGSILSDPDRLFADIDDGEIVESYVKSIGHDIDRTDISLDSLRGFRILDVGTGRQAIAFHRLGAKRVDHYDISVENVSRLEAYIAGKALRLQVANTSVG